MQGPHRRHEADCKPRFAPGGDRIAERCDVANNGEGGTGHGRHIGRRGAYVKRLKRTLTSMSEVLSMSFRAASLNKSTAAPAGLGGCL